MERTRTEPEETAEELRERLESLREQLEKLAAGSPAGQVRNQSIPPEAGQRSRPEP